jgi:hypothetical protein
MGGHHPVSTERTTCLKPTEKAKERAVDLTKSGGPAHPTLNGAKLDDNTFRWEGMTLFDFYVGQFIVTGMSPSAAIKQAADVVKRRNEHLFGE